MDVAVNLRQFRMRCGAPSTLDGLGRPPDLLLAQQQPRIAGGRRGEIFGQHTRRFRQCDCSTLVATGEGGATELVEYDAAVMARLLGREKPALCCLREGFARRLPTTLAGL